MKPRALMAQTLWPRSEYGSAKYAPNSDTDGHSVQCRNVRR